jgi:hypothetical protein
MGTPSSRSPNFGVPCLRAADLRISEFYVFLPSSRVSQLQVLFEMLRSKTPSRSARLNSFHLGASYPQRCSIYPFTKSNEEQSAEMEIPCDFNYSNISSFNEKLLLVLRSLIIINEQIHRYSKGLFYCLLCCRSKLFRVSPPDKPTAFVYLRTIEVHHLSSTVSKL